MARGCSEEQPALRSGQEMMVRKVWEALVHISAAAAPSAMACRRASLHGAHCMHARKPKP